MQRLDGVVELIQRHQGGDTDLGSGDDQHVDALVAQCVEELGGQAGMGFHTDAHHGDLTHVGIHVKGLVTEYIVLFDEDLLHLLDRGFRHGEGNIGGADGSTRLHDHVDVHAGHGQLGKHLGRHAGLVRHATHGGQSLAAVVRNTGDDRGLRAKIGEQVAHGFVLIAHVLLPSLLLGWGFR